MEFFKDLKKEYSFLLRFESNDLTHTTIEVSFDGLSYRFPTNSITEWLAFNAIEWKWYCKKQRCGKVSHTFFILQFLANLQSFHSNMNLMHYFLK